MSSNIITSNIDKDFPVPGRDNDSAGFRNNFKSIVDNLDVAKEEIEDLQTNTAKTNSDTDFNQNNIINANFISCTENAFDLGNISTNTDVSFDNGSYQTANITGNLSLTFKDWPAEDTLGKITLALTNPTNNQYTVNWSTESAGTIKGNLGVPVQLYDSTDGSNIRLGAFPNPLVLEPNSETYILEFWTADEGQTVFANYIGEFADV
jgi:hypothetical protein